MRWATQFDCCIYYNMLNIFQMNFDASSHFFLRDTNFHWLENIVYGFMCGYESTEHVYHYNNGHGRLIEIWSR